MISPQTSEALVPLLTTGKGQSPCDMASLEAKLRLAEIIANHLVSTGDQMKEDYYAGNALPRDLAMNKILRYEKAAQKKLDWALENLLASQQRRKNSQTPS